MLYSRAIFSAESDPEPNPLENVDNTVGYSKIILALRRFLFLGKTFKFVIFGDLASKSRIQYNI